MKRFCAVGGVHALLFAAALGAGPALATSPPTDIESFGFSNSTNPTYGYVNLTVSRKDGLGSYRFSTFNPYGTTDGTIVLQNTPYVSVSSNTVSTCTDSQCTPNQNDTEATLIYSVVVNGPANTVVPLNFSGSYFLSGTGAARSDAIGTSDVLVYVQGSRYMTDSCGGRYDFNGGNCGLFHYSGTTDVLAGTSSTPGSEGQFTLVADTVTALDGVASAWIDPVVTIDPAFLAQNPGYSLAFSNGIQNISAVPEPSAWALMLVGFGVTAAALRRRPTTPARAGR